MSLKTLPLALTLALLPFASACDEDADEGDTHDTHDTHGGSGGDADTQLHWHAMPPMAMTAGEATDVMWNVHTEGEIHISELRACEGHVEECGHGEADSFDVSFAATEAEGMYMASVMFEAAGDWTVVAYAHVGPDPFISPAVMVTVE